MIPLLALLSLLVAVSYVGAVTWMRRSLPVSISSLVYVFDRPWQWLWTVWLWAVGLLLAPRLFECVPEAWGIAAHVFVTSLMFTGAIPLAVDEENTVHDILGITAGVASQVCVLLIAPEWLWSWSAVPVLWLLSLLWKGLDGRGVFVVECVCAVSVYGALLLTM